MKSTPLRAARERLLYCDQYFASVGANRVCSTTDYREYELPRDVDKELTDRPFFWMWAERMGQDVPKTVLRLAFSEEAAARENKRLREEAITSERYQRMTDVERMFFRPPAAELVDLGSFRLEKILDSAATRGQFASVVPQLGQGPIVPWLMMNGLISYRCDTVQEVTFSIAICLVNGQIVRDFFQATRKIPMRSVEPNVLLERSTIACDKGIQKVQQVVQQIAAERPSGWARDAWDRLDDELAQTDTYYASLLLGLENEEERSMILEERNRKKQELDERSRPRIQISWKQLGLVGLYER